MSDAEVEFRSLQMVNTARQQEGVSPQLSLEDAIASVARAHSEAMRDQDFFGHVDPQGHRLGDRLQAGGVAFRVAAENLARVSGPGDPASAAHQLLMASAEHRHNILDPQYRLAGVGVARRGDTFWMTQIFVRTD